MAASVTRGTQRILIDTRRLTYGNVNGVELLPSGSPFWAVQVRNLTSRILPPVSLRLGSGVELPIRAQGDFIRFVEAEESGLRLVPTYRRPVFAGGIFLDTAWIELLVFQSPNVADVMVTDDPWASAPRFTRGFTQAAAAGLFPFARVVNFTGPSNGDPDTVVGIVRRIVVTSSIDGMVEVRSDNAAPAGGAVAGGVLYKADLTPQPGRLGYNSGSNAALQGATRVLRFGVSAGVGVPMPLDFELQPPDPGFPGIFTALAVNGPPGVSTLNIEFDVLEIPII